MGRVAVFDFWLLQLDCLFIQIFFLLFCCCCCCCFGCCVLRCRRPLAMTWLPFRPGENTQTHKKREREKMYIRKINAWCRDCTFPLREKEREIEKQRVLISCTLFLYISVWFLFRFSFLLLVTKHTHTHTHIYLYGGEEKRNKKRKILLSNLYPQERQDV